MNPCDTWAVEARPPRILSRNKLHITLRFDRLRSGRRDFKLNRLQREFQPYYHYKRAPLDSNICPIMTKEGIKVYSSSPNWANKSVVAFAQGSDPVQAMIKRSREIVLHAIDQGWSGPPFDPLQLADILKINVVPSENVHDARSVPLAWIREFTNIKLAPCYT